MRYSQANLISTHFTALAESYKCIGDQTWLANDFMVSNLASSRQLYEVESLQSSNPRPKSLEVYALLSGLPFAEDLIDALQDIQLSITEIIGNTSSYYWVQPQNLGLEYCVFKWPDEAWHATWSTLIEQAISQIDLPAYQFDIRGVQINPDGCVVARGFDHEKTLFNIREHMKAELPFLPARQSTWAHIPLGRILQPVGTARFDKLATFIQSLESKAIASTEIDTLRFIRETRWYMEEHETLSTYSLR